MSTIERAEQPEIMGSRAHSRVQANLVVALDQLDNFVVYSELSLDIADVEYRPDICLYPLDYEITDYLNDDVRVTTLPVLIVEILSPRQYLSSITEKFAVYFNAGIASCWLVLPMAKTVLVYSSPHDIHAFNDEIVDPKLAMRIPLAAIFKRKGAAHE